MSVSGLCVIVFMCVGTQFNIESIEDELQFHPPKIVCLCFKCCMTVLFCENKVEYRTAKEVGW